MKSTAVKLIALMAPALLVADCTIGPHYKRPEVAAPHQFRAQIAPSEAASFADLPFWNVFDDPALHQLITEALAHNYDLQVAVTRIEQARQDVAIAESEGKPQVGYQVFAGGERTIGVQNGTSGTSTFGTFAGLISAAWEMDVWGRIRHTTEAAEANLMGQEDVRRGVILTLVSDLAADYFRLVGLDRQLAIAEDSNRVFKRTLDLFSDRYHAGMDSELPVQRAQAALDSSTAQIADLKRQIGQLEDAISVLAGAFPRDIARGRALTDQVLPATPLGATTDVLRRRPDIMQSEQAMIGANAEIGVAMANFYPKVGLSALFGGQAIGISNSFAGYTVGNIIGDIAGPITTGGRLHALYQKSKAYWDETLAEYKKSVLTAFQETSDALIAQQNLVGQRAGLERQAAALKRSVDLALERYDAGRASYFEVLEAEQQLFPAEDAVAQTQRDQLLAVVNLYKALGGGWEASETQLTKTASQSP
jgi:multidrug efflux system outer membrane protein